MEILSQQQVVFKTKLFGGFEKKAVLSYIYQVNESARQAEEKLGQQLAEVTASREELSHKIGEFESKISKMEQDVSELNSELFGERAKSSEMGALVDRLNDEIGRQRNIIREKDMELDTYKSRIVELASVSAKYEKASSQIGMLLIDAKTRADQMIEEAAVRSEEIIQGANDTVSHLFSELDDFRREVEQIRATVGDAIASIQERLDNISDSIENSESTLQEYRGTKVEDEGSGLIADMPDNDELPEDFFRGASGQ